MCLRQRIRSHPLPSCAFSCSVRVSRVCVYCALQLYWRIRAEFMDKRSLTERDICTKFITPALRNAGWDEMLQIREEFGFTKGRIIVRGKLVSRGRAKRADYILYYKPNIPLALIEAKDNSHSIGDGIQQGLDYATTLNIPFVFSSNGETSRGSLRVSSAQTSQASAPSPKN